MSRWLEDCLLSIWRRRGLISTLLTPLSRLYGWLAGRHLRARAATAWRAPVPVVVIGNILVGGTGKTPVATAVCQALQAAGWHPGIVSRGYGTRLGPRARLSDQDASSHHLGDEPAVLHATTGAPVSVHPRRVLAAQSLLAAHPEVDVLIADDALQHLALARDLEIIVQDARGIGNGRLLPAGPLREPPGRLQRAHWLITHLAATDSADSAGSLIMRLQPEQVEHLASGQYLPWDQWLGQHASSRCSAAAGIGQPERFFAMLRAAGVTLGQCVRVPDHQIIAPVTLRALPQAPILITPKDAVKLVAPQDSRLWVVHARAVFSDPGWLDALHAALCKAAAARGATLSHKGGARP